MDLAKISDLKRGLAEATDLPNFWQFYLDNYAVNHDFLDLGRQITGPKLYSLIGRIAGQLLRQNTLMLINSRLVELPECNVIHGFCLINDKLMCILFFSDLGLGLAAISSTNGTGDLLFDRFSMAKAQASAAVN